MYQRSIKKNMNDLHTLQKKLQFKSSHRGSKEMDILLGSFVEKYITLFNEGELQMLEAILELDDNDIYRYALDKVTIPKAVSYTHLTLPTSQYV